MSGRTTCNPTCCEVCVHFGAGHVSDSSFPVELCSIRIIRFANKAVTEVMHHGKYIRTHYRKMWRVESTLQSEA